MKRALAVMLALLWITVIFILYYAGHKPLTPEVALGIGLAVWRVLAAALLVCLAGGLGYALLSFEEHTPLVRLALQAAVGLGIFSLGVLLVGGILGLPGWLLWAAPGFLLVLLRHPMVGWVRQLTGLGELWRKSGRLGRLLGAGLGLLAFTALWVALAPPLFFDSLVDHLVLPASYLQLGRISHLPWTVMSGMPQNAEMLYTWAMALGGSEAAATLGLAIGLLAMVGLLGYLRERLDGRAAWVGAAALLAGYTPVALLASAYDDWLVFLFGLAALVCLDDWSQSARRTPLLLAGIFVGLAVGSKYTSAVLAAAGLAVITWQVWTQRRGLIQAALRYGLAALLVALPWLAKNWLVVGNPLYPFFFSSDIESQVHFSVFQSVGPWGNWSDVVLIPLRATLAGFEQADGYMASIGPLLLALGALAWLGRKAWSPWQRAAFQNALVLAATGFLVWAICNQYNGLLIQTRYYFSIFPAFAVLAGYGDWGLRGLRLPHLRPGLVAGALVLLALGLNLLEFGLKPLQQGAPQAALGLKPQADYLAGALGWFQPAMQAVNALPEGSKVLLLYEPRSLYCLPRCTGDTIMDRWKSARALSGSTQAILQSWSSQGYTHLLVYRQGLDFLVEAGDPNHPPEDRSSLLALLATLPQPVSFGGVYELYSFVN